VPTSILNVLTAVSTMLAPFPVTVPRVPESVHSVVYQVMTNEIATEMPSGQEIEVYRFDPGVFVVDQGDEVVLKFYGLKGHEHPIVLDGYNVHAVIRKNELTALTFKADKPGLFRLWCTAHPDVFHNGPMEGYVVVLPK
jgi:plastocyanin